MFRSSFGPRVRRRAVETALVGSTALVLCLSCKGSEVVLHSDASDAPAYDVVVEPTAHPTVQVTMNAFDIGGSGTNTHETFLNVGNVNPAHFGKLFAQNVDGEQFAQPLYLGAQTMSDGKKHNVVFVATEHDTVYAFDADDGQSLWSTSMGKSVPFPNPWFGVIQAPVESCKAQGFNMTETGITSTPVIDPTTGTLYVVALNEDDSDTLPEQTCNYSDPADANYCMTYRCNPPSITYRLHAIDVTSGAERAGSPVTIAGEVLGAGSTSSRGKIAFSAMTGLIRTGLLLDYGTIYFATASYSDLGAYHGFIFAYDATTLERKAVMSDTPNGSAGGIWMSGHLMLSDHQGYVYAVTGNGTFDSNAGGKDYGDSILKLDRSTLEVVDWFSPFLSDYMGENFLEDFDDDLGSAGATMIPNTTLLLASGKRGNGYLVDTANLGHFHATGDTVVQTVRLAWPYNKMGCDHVADSWIYGTPAIWEGPDATHVYVWGSFDYLRDYKLNDSGQFSTQGICFCPPGWTLNDESKTFTIEVSDPPCAVLSTMNAEHVDALTGAGMSVSSNGKVPGTGIVWATRPGPGDPVSQSIPGVLEAYDATYLATPLWSSATNAARDNLGSWAKFVQPTIANGKVYMATQSNQLVVYGLLPAK